MKGALLELIHKNKKEEVRDMKIRGSFGCSGHEIVEFRILRGGTGQTAGPQPRISEEQTQTSSEICLE